MRARTLILLICACIFLAGYVTLKVKQAQIERIEQMEREFEKWQP